MRDTNHVVELTFLGTSSGAPTNTRNVTGLAVRWGPSWDLFDCGEATQHQLLRTPLTLPKLRRIFISHLHGDHCYGLFGLIGSRSMAQAGEPLTIYGPEGVRAMVETVLAASSTYLTAPLRFVEVGDEGEMVDTGDGRTASTGSTATTSVAMPTIEAVPLTHRVTSFAWSIREPDRLGRLDAAAAERLGVQPGPDFGKLQRGETVAGRDGATVRPADVLGPSRPGRHLVIAGDNSDPARLLARCRGADVLVHEATYTEQVLAHIGDDHGHSTAARVARAADDHGVRTLLLTHFSARFGDSGEPSIADVEAEARSHYSGPLHLANDFDRYLVDADGAVALAHAITRG